MLDGEGDACRDLDDLMTLGLRVVGLRFGRQFLAATGTVVGNIRMRFLDAFGGEQHFGMRRMPGLCARFTAGAFLGRWF